MNEQSIRVLLIEDNSGDARLIQEALGDVERARFELVYAHRLSTGLALLGEESPDIVLLDLSLPDSQGLETLQQIRQQAPETPVVVLTGLNDQELAVRAVQSGAQDYLIKGQEKGNPLVRALHYAIERNRLQEELRALSLEDELTGLHNRRGFLTLARQQLNMVYRTRGSMVLLFADLDGLKQINDTLGHRQGDLALIETATILKETFREADILARMGGDEFGVLALETSQNDAETITTRLRKTLEHHNAQQDRRYSLSLSLGVAFYDPENPSTIEELLAQADARMYQQKQGSPT